MFNRKYHNIMTIMTNSVSSTQIWSSWNYICRAADNTVGIRRVLSVSKVQSNQESRSATLLPASWSRHLKVWLIEGNCYSLIASTIRLVNIISLPKLSNRNNNLTQFNNCSKLRHLRRPWPSPIIIMHAAHCCRSPHKHTRTLLTPPHRILCILN